MGSLPTQLQIHRRHCLLNSLRQSRCWQRNRLRSAIQRQTLGYPSPRLERGCPPQIGRQAPTLGTTLPIGVGKKKDNPPMLDQLPPFLLHHQDGTNSNHRLAPSLLAQELLKLQEKSRPLLCEGIPREGPTNHTPTHAMDMAGTNNTKGPVVPPQTNQVFPRTGTIGGVRMKLLGIRAIRVIFLIPQPSSKRNPKRNSLTPS